ncbi:MAG: hypothetical protein ACM3ST_13975 [Bdellovibrio bacteriovorus]
MKLCPKCGRSPWPFVMVVLVASVTAFVTWITLGLTVDEPAPRLAASALVFLAVGGTLLHYVLACLKRHCRHGKEHPLEARLRRPSHGQPR